MYASSFFHSRKNLEISERQNRTVIEMAWYVFNLFPPGGALTPEKYG